MDDIAVSAGLTRATLYYHYRGKAEIFAEAVLVILGFVQEEATRVLNQHDLSVRERLTQYVSARRAGNLPDFDRTTEAALSETMVWATLPHLAPRQRTRVTEKLDLLHEATRAVFAEGVENGELRPLPVSVLDYAFWQLFNPDSYPEPLEMSREQWEDHLMIIFLGSSAS